MNLLIQNGRVIDPSQKLDAVTDVAFAGGKVAMIGSELKADPGTDVRDVSDEYALLAVQGPRALERLDLPKAKAFTWSMGQLDGVNGHRSKHGVAALVIGLLSLGAAGALARLPRDRP